MKVSVRLEEKKGGGGMGWSYKYLEQEGEGKMCHFPPSSVCSSVLLLHLKFTGRHRERWMDGLREGEGKRDGGVCRCPLKGKEHLDSSSGKKTTHVFSLHFSLSLYSSLLFIL